MLFKGGVPVANPCGQSQRSQLHALIDSHVHGSSTAQA